MKNKLFKFLLLAVCLMVPAFVFSQEVKGFQELEAPLFMDKIQDENNHILIDVRSAEDFRKGRIRGAINVPESAVMNSILDTLDHDCPVLIYCLLGKRSKMAAQKILEKYEVTIYGLSGGLNAWKEAGFKLNKKRIRKKR